MELKDTVELMNSKDFKDRFRAEYYQTKIRYDKLHAMVVKMEAGTLEFKPTCTLEDFKDQLKHMGGYLYRLEIRAKKEKIDLELPNNYVSKNRTLI